MVAIRTALACAAAAWLSACAIQPTLDAGLNPNAPGVVYRQFDCLETASDGSCNKKQCKSSVGGFEYDCANYAYYCVKAGHTWNGNKDLGTCTRKAS